jgi:hypothetical protein
MPGWKKMVVVGLSYANGDGGIYSRRRDYAYHRRANMITVRTSPGRQPTFVKNRPMAS